MKKSTKRLLSTVLAASMLFTSVYVSPVTAATADEAVVAAAVDSKVAWSADDLEPVVKGSFTAALALGDMYSFQPNTKNSAIDGNDKTFSDGFSFKQRIKPGGSAKTDGTGCFTVTAPSAGKLKVYFVTGSNGEGRAISFMDSTYKELASATSGPIADATTYVYEPAVFEVPAAGTYYVGGMAAAVNVYGMTFAPEGTEFPTAETTTEATTAAADVTTEATTAAADATTEATTAAADATTEATTAAPAKTERMEGDIISDTEGLATGSYCGGQLEIHDLSSAGVEAAAWGNKPLGFEQDINGIKYTTFVQGANNPKDSTGKQSYNAPGKLVVPEQGAFIKVVPTADATLILDFKVASGKYYAFMSVDAAGTKTELDFIAPTVDEFFHKEYALTAGNTYYVTSAGTKTCFLGIALAGGATVETTEATTAEAPTEATTAEAPTAAPTEATTAEAPTEATTQAVVVEGKFAVSAYVDGVENVNGAQKVEATEVGKTVKVNVDVTDGGYNNYTFFIKYNPSVLKAKAVAEPTDVSKYSTYNGKPVYDPETVNNSITYVPKNDNPDYTDVKADGTKTCAELGKVKFANYLPTAGAKADKGGTVVAVEFDVVGQGSSDLEIILVENGFFAEPGSAKLEVATPETVKVNVGDVTETTEATTAAVETTEATTEATTEEITVPAGTLGLKVTPNGKFDLEAGEELVLNIDTNNADTASFNNYTFFLTYNPKVIEAVGAVDPENPAKTASGNVAYDKNNIDSSLNFKPSKTNPDFADVPADGATSSAALGKVKIANYVNSSSDVVNTDGSLLSIKFVVKGEGNADVNITVLGFNGAVTADALNVQVLPADVIIAAEETTTEATTSEATTELGSEATTEAVETTEATTEATTEEITVPAGTLGLKVTPNGKFDLEAGEELVLNIDTNNADTASFNNYTFFLTYNPKVIEAVGAVDPENPAKTASGNVAYDKNNIDSSLSFKPSKTNPDFADVPADGATSSAALGKVKIANYVSPSSDVVNTDGSLLSIKFVVKGEGNADVNITVLGFNGAETADALNVQVLPADVIIAAEETTTEATTSETTTEATTSETTTETGSEATTETGSESTTETVIGLEAVGDVNMDGIWTANDAAFLIQRVLDRTFNLPCADPAYGGYPDKYYYIADVTADGILTADDAANILQRALDSSFAFKMDEVIKGNVPYEYPVEQ